jgi:predicted nucleic acid-binding protein
VSTQTFLLDSDTVTDLARDRDVARRAIEAHSSGRARLLVTSVVSWQKGKIPSDQAHRSDCLALLRSLEPVPTTGLILDAGILAFDNLADDEDTDPFRTGGRGGDSDAVIGATAKAEGAALVTRDIKLTKKARAEGVDVWVPNDLIARIKEMTDGEGQADQ